MTPATLHFSPCIFGGIPFSSAENENCREIQVEGYSTTKNILDITTDVFNIVAPLHYGIRFYKRNCSDMFESIQRNAKIHLEMD